MVIVKIAEEKCIETNQGKQKIFNKIAQKCKDKSIKENIGELGEIISMIDSYIEFAEKYLFIGSENYSLEDKTNPHGILHGAYSDLDYGKPINFYKCISAIDIAMLYLGGWSTKFHLAISESGIELYCLSPGNYADSTYLRTSMITLRTTISAI